MGGILKNPLTKDQIPNDSTHEDIAEFRKQVFKNTQLNAKLNQAKNSTQLNKEAQELDLNDIPNNGNGIDLDMQDNDAEYDTNGIPHTFSDHKRIPKDILSLKREADERMKWNEKNLADNEIAKLQYQDIHVDEPKTPYQGAVDPNGEYYKVDEDETNDNFANLDTIDDFSLGEPEFKPNRNERPAVVHMNEDNNEEEEEEEDDEPQYATEEEEKAARRRKFEEMRKKHYNVKEIFQKKRLHALDNEEDEEDDE
ncbi:hypothetical protein TBLA_0C07140 [Henningerozyma blattae CBS 6284]|uniref:Protein GLC8 n=1 Tax=Henningerozyma blattae (strain ATCC 34711 / CBS 6284 / DSM 70876 / NBRC 10599 / NRRL Y-10934 / UCD 77-7) TaxID=1071380 RepID=I2H2A3_HENB6|nr:hypothetical protein TBLA_0C07140 [Tetrapisispora blattae CBS 6284]CCH60505.1 hypothetical protein TBLA_0C07140 [Tetrapisispora blattae CBS 6284]